jgi:hypothetical protein
LALDGWGYPHIAYYATTTGNLKYAHSDGAGWNIETVDWRADVGRYASLALDDSGYPHISYFDATLARLNHAQKNAAGWQIEIADSAGGEHCSLALDAQGCPHISYLFGWDVRYAHRSDLGEWSSESIGNTGMWPGPTSLALDEYDSPRIGYQWTPGAIWPCTRYAYKDSGWHTEVVTAFGSQICLALGPTGRPHLTWALCAWEPPPVLKYACADAFPIVLSSEVVDGELVLEWGEEPWASAYWVYGASNQAHFSPGFFPGYQNRLAVLAPIYTTWSSPSGIGDPNNNWTYMVLAVNAAEEELCRSNRVGEWDFLITWSD